jgi:hypothetical protein
MKALKFAVLVVVIAAASGCATEKKYSDLDWPFAVKSIIALIR